MSALLGARGRLFLLALSLMVVVGGGGLVLLEERIRSWVDVQLEAGLLEKARVVDVAVASLDAEQLSDVADELGAALQGRVTLIRADGVVLGDSARNEVELVEMDNHGTRPEVLAAHQNGVGVARRFSDTLQLEMLYVAVSSDDGGVVRVAMPRTELSALQQDLRGLFLLSVLTGLAVAIGMSLMANRWVSRDIQDLILQAKRTVESGSGRLEVTGRRGLGELVGAFNQLAASLEETIGDLAVERDRLGSILEGLGEAVIALDAAQCITLVNPKAVDLFGFSGSPHGQSFTALLPDTALQTFIEDVSGADPKIAEFTLPGPSGKQRQLMITATPQRSGSGCLLVCRDVTNLRRLERIRSDFVANVSHELRTPVAVIRINAETLRDGAISDPDHGPRFVDGIHRNAERLSRLLTDLLDISQLEAGHYQLSTASYSLAKASAQALGQIEHKAEARRQNIRIEVPRKLRARCDLPALEQVLTNLLDNAVKYCPEGSTIVLRAAREARWVRLEVIDNGNGIPKQHLGRLFERFYRVDPGRSRDMGGTGLGLSIVRHLVESMGGRIGVTSVVGQGTTFWLLLPTKKNQPLLAPQ